MNRHDAASRTDRRRTTHRSLARRLTRRRRGVSSVLAMMFMVIFSSLAAVMAVVAQGNLRTADSAMKVSRAMSAAETGLVFASRRLASEASRFVVEKGVIDLDFGYALWLGGPFDPADGAVDVLPPVGYTEGTPAEGVAEAVLNAHLFDSHSFLDPDDPSLPSYDPISGTLRVRPIALTVDDMDNPDPRGPYFRLKYELLANAPVVRVTAQGVDGHITRTIQMDFRINKKIEYAIISPNRIMIGKNVRVEGPLGSRYGIVAGELDAANGDPLVMRSDFYYLDPALDITLDLFYSKVADFDVDGDSRLRPDHPIEGLGAAGFVDYDLDEYVDDFDLFLAFYDTNADGVVEIAVEFFNIDNQLARLIDEAFPDRDGDGVLGSQSDIDLGYNDGILDGKDRYAKVHGRLMFAVAQTDWDTANEPPSYQTVVQGPGRVELDQAPVSFEVSDEELREITTDMFSDTQTWFEAQVPNDPPEDPVNFNAQVAAGEAAGGMYTLPSDAPWEDVPYGVSNAGGAPYDYYQRQIYTNMTFTDVRIPMGNNGLFENCTFVGVTYIETEADCSHFNWNYAGARKPLEEPPGSGNFTYPFKFDPNPQAELSDGTLVPESRDYSNNVRFDNCTFLGSIAGDKPDEFTHWRNKVQITGETRFYIDPEDPDLLKEIADGHPNALGWQNTLEGMDAADIEELSKSSMLMPGWSVDVGNFTNELATKVKLKGTIVAGILDVRGTADVFGTLLMTFRPIAGAGPLFYGGLPDAFNTTIGYFGPSDGDGEGVDPDDATFNGFGEITLRYDPNAMLPDGIPWPIQINSEPLTYVEGGSL
ncbi:MAG: hypothetical protein IIB53_05565 [Planctomycetes bacterium]|nr:hypothetical protein [Planctomycetota bacterium]